MTYRVMTKQACNYRLANSVLALMKIVFALVLLILCCIDNNNAMASIGSIGPDASVNLRYNLTSYGSHKYTSLSIPIYFQSNPGTVTVESFDLYVRRAKASFDGGPAVGDENHKFTVSGFEYDGVSGLYKRVINVELRNENGGFGNWTSWEVYQFRLKLVDPSNGWITYGGGRVSQADPDYYKYVENGNYTSLGKNQEMYMALPCTYKDATNVSASFWDLDEPAGGDPVENGGHHITVAFYDVTDNNKKLKSFYGPDYPDQMGNNKTLTYKFTMYPGHLYRVVVSNIWVGNLIEYELPFDNISYATGCWESEAQSQVSLDNKNWKTGRSALTNVRPNSRLYWKHTVRNTTAWDMKDDVSIKVNEARYNSSDDIQLSSRNISSTKGKGRAGVTFFNETNSINATQNEVGMRICQDVSWTAIAYNNVGVQTSDAACAYIPYHYPGYQSTNEPSNQFSDCTQTGTCPNATPKGGIQLSTSVANDKTIIVPGESVKFIYTLSNSGPTKSKALTYKAYTFILKGGTGLPSNANHMSTYPAGWQNVDCNSNNVNSGNRGTCLGGKEGSDLVIDPLTPKSITSDSYTIANEWLGNPGDQICSYIAANNNWSVYDDTSANSYAISNVTCVKIGKKPQVQINGSDSYARGGFVGSSYADIAINTNRGSYSQYGLLTGSNGSIANFGTAGYTNISNTNKTKACKLAYANTAGPTNTNCSLLGKAGINRTISIPAKINAGNVVSTELNVGDVGAGGSNMGDAYYRANGDLEIHGTLKEGNRITVYVDGDVTITDNIDTVNGETGRYDTLAQIPSLTIVASGDIRVNGNVTLINANLVAAGGSLDTCYNATNEDLGLVGKCSNKLKINGAVISKNSPKLLRTFGSGNFSDYTDQWDANTTSSTSEWFNYTPNSWLVPNVGSMNSAITGYNTASISGLPARY